MSKKIIFLLLFSLSISLKTRLRTKTQTKRKHLEKCNFLHWCEHGLKCIDYTCLNKTERENYVELEWAPKGKKCNFIHKCENNSFICEENICKLKNNSNTNESIINFVKENLKLINNNIIEKNQIVNEIAVNLTNQLLGIEPNLTNLENKDEDNDKNDNENNDKNDNKNNK